MRVALVTNFCPHYRVPLYEELARRMDLTLILTSNGSEWYWEGERPPDPPGLRVVRASTPPAVARELRSGSYHAAIIGLTGRGTLLAALAAVRVSRIPFVLWVGIWTHPQTWVHPLSRVFARRLYRSAAAVVTYGDHVSSFIERESGRTDNVFVAPQAVEGEKFRAPVSAAEVEALVRHLSLGEAPTVLYVGRVTEGKGIGYLLAASARAEATHTLVVAGTGPLLESMKARARALGIGDRVRFVGIVSQSELPALLQASDLFVLPSVSTPGFLEPWGLVVNEAMSAGLPVISTDAVGAAAGGLVIDGLTGAIVPQRNSGALAAALDELLGDRDKRRRFGAAGMARVLEWNYDAAADGFERALSAAMKGQGICVC